MGQIVQKNVSEVKVKPPMFTGIQRTTDVPKNNSADLLGEYLAKNFKYPDVAAECQIEGTGIVRFSVRPNGELTDFEVVNSVCPAIDEEFVRVLKSTSGMWNSGYNNNVPTLMEKEASMMFVVIRKKDPGEYFLKKSQELFTKGNNMFLAKGKTRKALRLYNQSIKFMPYETSSLLLRGLCRYELGDENGACSDWNRINAIGKYDANSFLENLCGMKGYSEMIQILDINQE